MIFSDLFTPKLQTLGMTRKCWPNFDDFYTHVLRQYRTNAAEP